MTVARIEPHPWERIIEGWSHPAHGVSVAKWRRFLSKLPHDQLKLRAAHGGALYHPVRVNLQHHHVKKLVMGRGVEVSRSQVVGHEHDGQLVLLPSDQAEKLLDILRSDAKKHSFKLRLTERHIQHNLRHGGGLFDSFGDFVSGVWDGVKTVGNFVLDVGPGLLDAIADILPSGSPQLIAARAALKAAADITRKVDGIRKAYGAAQDKKDAARAQIDAEKQKALEKEIKLREAGAKAEAIAKAKADAKKRIEQLKATAQKVGAAAVKEKKALAAAAAKEKAAASKAETAIKKAQEAAEKVKGRK